MASQTKGKRTASKAALKNAPTGRRRLKAKSRSAFPAGSKKTKREVEQVVLRMTRL